MCYIKNVVTKRKKDLIFCCYNNYNKTVAESEVKSMSPRTGRPKSENPKDIMIRVRMDEDTVKMLDECADSLKSSRSEIIRAGVKKVYLGIKK